MRLVSFLDDAGDRLGVEHSDGRIWSSRVARRRPARLHGRPAGRRRGGARGRCAAAARRRPRPGAPGDVDPHARISPVPRPGKVVAIGLNYRDHAAELGLEIPERAADVRQVPDRGHRRRRHRRMGPRPDRRRRSRGRAGHRHRPPRHAASAKPRRSTHVLGYTCLNDVTARDLQFSDGQFVRSKSLDTFCPLGPVVVTADELATPATSRCAATATARSCRTRAPPTSSSACPTWSRSARRRSRWSPATSSPRARPAASATSASPKVSHARWRCHEPSRSRASAG